VKRASSASGEWKGFPGALMTLMACSGSRTVTGALGCFRPDHVDAAQAEERSGGKEVSVVRVDLAVSVLSRAGEVKGIGGPQKNVGRGVLKKSFHPLLDRIGQGQPYEQAVV